jgi:hypothetical protein
MSDADGWGSSSGPPRRLVDAAGQQRLDAAGIAPPTAHDWAIDLLRSAPPYEVPAGRKQRVKLSLGHVPARRAPLVLRAAVAGVVLLGCGAIASAALGRARWPEWMARAYDRLVPTASQSPSRSAPRAHAHRAAPVDETRSALAPSAVAVEPPPLAPPAGAPAATAPTPRRALALAPSDPALRARRTGSPVSAPAATEDTSPVLEAMRALRLERNPVRARALLARYLERHPTGTLAEEALAISIEAAVAHHDADAAALSARYLRLYPLGPFRGIAQQTLAAAHGAPPAP